MGRLTKMLDDFLSAGDKEQDVDNNDLDFEMVPDDRFPTDEETIRDLREMAKHLREEQDDMARRAISRNSTYEQEASDNRRMISELVAENAKLTAQVDQQFDDLANMTIDIHGKVEAFKARIFFLHQLLVAIGGYDGENVFVPKNLARTALDEVLKGHFPDEEDGENVFVRVQR